MSTRISSLSMRTTLPSTTSPCLRLRISPDCSLSSSSMVVGSGRGHGTGTQARRCRRGVRASRPRLARGWRLRDGVSRRCVREPRAASPRRRASASTERRLGAPAPSAASSATARRQPRLRRRRPRLRRLPRRLRRRLRGPRQWLRGFGGDRWAEAGSSVSCSSMGVSVAATVLGRGLVVYVLQFVNDRSPRVIGSRPPDTTEPGSHARASMRVVVRVLVGSTDSSVTGRAWLRQVPAGRARHPITHAQRHNHRMPSCRTSTSSPTPSRRPWSGGHDRRRRPAAVGRRGTPAELAPWLGSACCAGRATGQVPDLLP